MSQNLKTITIESNDSHFKMLETMFKSKIRASRRNYDLARSTFIKMRDHNQKNDDSIFVEIAKKKRTAKELQALICADCSRAAFKIYKSRNNQRSANSEELALNETIFSVAITQLQFKVKKYNSETVHRFDAGADEDLTNAVLNKLKDVFETTLNTYNEQEKKRDYQNFRRLDPENLVVLFEVKLRSFVQIYCSYSYEYVQNVQDLEYCQMRYKKRSADEEELTMENGEEDYDV